MKTLSIAILCAVVLGVALIWIPVGPALPPGLTFAQSNQNNFGSNQGGPSSFSTLTVSGNGAASASQFNITGSCFLGTGTTSTPCLYLNQGTAPTTWSTSGTELGINAPTGFGGNFFDVHVNGGASVFKVDSAGNITGNFITGTNSIQTSAGGALNWQGSTKMLSPSDGLIALENNAGTSFTRLDFGGTTSSFPALCTSGVVTSDCLADGTTAAFHGLGTTTVAALPAAAAGNKGQMIAVSDSTAVASEGQTCAGSSTNTALAFSNGTVWKCF